MTTKVLDELPRVENSSKSPCWQQEQIAAQNSYVDSIRSGKVMAWRAPCKADQPAPAAKKPPTVDADKAKRVG